MTNRLGPIEITCDAPAYAIVRTCHNIAIQTPEDVRWCRVSHFLAGHYGPRAALDLQAWKNFLGLGKPLDITCTCGQKLPSLEEYVFVFLHGKEAHYLIGQCGKCRTVFWEEV